MLLNGIYDALSIEAVGNYKAIALTGTAQTRLLNLIEEQKKKSIYILMLDNDEAGENGNKEIEEKLKERNIKYISYRQYIEYIQDKEIGACKDCNEMLTYNNKQFTSLIKYLYGLAEDIMLEAYSKNTLASYFDIFMNKAVTEAYKPISTGYFKFNDALGGGIINQSIVNIGGASSVGKTAFMLQLLKQMIKNHKAIYFTLEMSVEQIMARLISSLVYDSKHYFTLHLTPNKILQGYNWTDEEKQVIKLMMNNFKDDAKNLTIINPVKPTIEEMLNEAKKVKDITGEAPMLFIDYIQLLQSDNSKDDMQTIIKQATKKLKDYAIQNNTIVFIISAFNRDANKNKEATMESGRDTSDLEYSSDYMFSLIFTEYEKGNRTIDIDDLKQESPRKITVKIQKNRMGETGKKVNFEFITDYQAFKEVGIFESNYKPTTATQRF